MVQEYFPCSLNVQDRNCWVIGWTRETLDKAGKLAEAGAQVTAVAPDFPPDLRKKLRRMGVRVLNRPFKLNELKAQFFVIFCPKDRVMARRVAVRCRFKKILLCAIDQADFCDVVNVSVFKKGLLKISVGTSGAAPGVARKIREGLESSLKNVPLDKYLDRLAALRRQVNKKGWASERKIETLLRAVNGFSFKAGVKFPARWNRK